MSKFRCRMSWSPIPFSGSSRDTASRAKSSSAPATASQPPSRRPIKCQDGYARIFCNQPDHWKRLVEWLGNPAELMDPKFENVQNRHPLRPVLGPDYRGAHVDAMTRRLSSRNFNPVDWPHRPSIHPALSWKTRRRNIVNTSSKSIILIWDGIVFPAILTSFPKARAASTGERRSLENINGQLPTNWSRPSLMAWSEARKSLGGDGFIAFRRHTSSQFPHGHRRPGAGKFARRAWRRSHYHRSGSNRAQPAARPAISDRL